MIIRPATLQDMGAIYEMACEQAARYEKLRIDRDKMKHTIRTAISSKSHCALVVEEGNKVIGVLGGMTTQNVWAQKQACGISIWHSKNPFGLRRLLEEFLVWVKPRRGIRVAGFAPDIDCHPGIWRIAARLGFEKHGGAYLLYN